MLFRSEKAIKLDLDYALSYNNRGLAHNSLGEYEKAIRDFDKTIKLNPNYISAYNSRGVAYNNLKYYKKAISDFDKAIKLDPNYTFAYNNRAVVYNNLGKYVVEGMVPPVRVVFPCDKAQGHLGRHGHFPPPVHFSSEIGARSPCWSMACRSFAVASSRAGILARSSQSWSTTR